MGHVPHLYVSPPWTDETIELPEESSHHLTRVLRRRPGDGVTYTDGIGTIGDGIVAPEGIRRGSERTVAAPSCRLTLAVATPHRAERARQVVEKLAELGVDHLVWLATRYGGEARISSEKASRWSVGALEQSRGAFLMRIAGPQSIDQIEGRLWVAEPGAEPLPTAVEAGEVVVAVGPEGGFAPGEVPPGAARFGLGGRILRVETAAIVAATLFSDRSGRLRAENA